MKIFQNVDHRPLPVGVCTLLDYQMVTVSGAEGSKMAYQMAATYRVFFYKRRSWRVFKVSKSDPMRVDLFRHKIHERNTIHCYTYDTDPHIVCLFIDIY